MNGKSGNIYTIGSDMRCVHTLTGTAHARTHRGSLSSERFLGENFQQTFTFAIISENNKF